MAWRFPLLLVFGTALLVATNAARAQQPAAPLKAGIIGCDTSHVIAFTKLLNDPNAPADLAGVRITAAYPGGSADMPLSRDRVGKFTDELKARGVVICDSIEELLPQVDVILLESVDGRTHLEQARPVIAAGKPLFIDKPMAASVADALEIFRLAQAKGVPIFSCSSLRFVPSYQAIRRGESPLGQIRSCAATSPMKPAPQHPDLFFYGIHGVEILFTILGPDCVEVTRTGPEEVEGLWAGGRHGRYKADKEIGAQIEGSLQSDKQKAPEAYAFLAKEIVKFFQTGQPPVPAEETVKILAFMEAADASQRQGGAAVTLESVLEKARQTNAQRP